MHVYSHVQVQHIQVSAMLEEMMNVTLLYRIKKRVVLANHLVQCYTATKFHVAMLGFNAMERR